MNGLYEPDAQPDATLDRVVDIATQLFAAPIALVSLVEETHQTFRAKKGLSACSTSREVSFCSHAVAQRALLIVEDARCDVRFADNPLVTGARGIRFYAGAPLITRAGHAVGALCIIDTSPRPGLDEREARLLSGLADLVIEHLERKRLSFANRTAMRLAAATADAMITADQSGAITFWNAAAEQIFGYSAAEVLGAPLELIIPIEQRAAHRRGMDRIIGRGQATVKGLINLQARRRVGALVPIEMSLAHWDDEGGMQFAAVIRDVTERRREQDDLHQLTHFDGLTGLPNRVAFLRAVEAQIRSSTACSVLKVGMDGFKHVNESLGLPAGDALLRMAAQRVTLAAGGKALTARLSADEFGVLLRGSDDPLEGAVTAERVIAALSEPFAFDGAELSVTASVGLVLSPGLARPASAQEALKQGLLALQAAKRAGGARHELFSVRMSQQAEERQRLDEALQQAVRNQEFEVHYQPQVRLTDEVVVGAEALLRWRHPERGLVSPAAFLHQLERSELAIPVGRWILCEACGFAAALDRSGAPIRIGVNLFASQLRSATFERDVLAALSESGLRPELLELEITETTVLGADDAVLAPLRTLREQGVSLAFDDYGTGFASLSLLKRYPISRLKIDREFVVDLDSDGADASIVRAVLALGASLGLEVIAEGVETPLQAALLRKMGCREAQGFLYGRATPASDFRVAVRPHDMLCAS